MVIALFAVFEMLNRFDPVVVRIPLVNPSVPPTVTASLRVAPEVLFKISLLKVDDGIVWAAAPLKVTVPPQVIRAVRGADDIF